MDKGRLSRSLRLVIASTFAVTLGVAFSPFAPAQAAIIQPPDPSPAPDFRTAFEIDGNKSVDGSLGANSIDWNSLLTFNPTTNTFTKVGNGTTPPYTLPATATEVGVQSTGIIASDGATDLDTNGGLCQ